MSSPFFHIPVLYDPYKVDVGERSLDAYLEGAEKKYQRTLLSNPLHNKAVHPIVREVCVLESKAQDKLYATLYHVYTQAIDQLVQAEGGVDERKEKMDENPHIQEDKTLVPKKTKQELERERERKELLLLYIPHLAFDKWKDSVKWATHYAKRCAQDYVFLDTEFKRLGTVSKQVYPPGSFGQLKERLMELMAILHGALQQKKEPRDMVVPYFIEKWTKKNIQRRPFPLLAPWLYTLDYHHQAGDEEAPVVPVPASPKGKKTRGKTHQRTHSKSFMPITVDEEGPVVPVPIPASPKGKKAKGGSHRRTPSQSFMPITVSSVTQSFFTICESRDQGMHASLPPHLWSTIHQATWRTDVLNYGISLLQELFPDAMYQLTTNHMPTQDELTSFAQVMDAQDKSTAAANAMDIASPPPSPSSTIYRKHWVFEEKSGQGDLQAASSFHPFHRILHLYHLQYTLFDLWMPQWSLVAKHAHLYERELLHAVIDVLYTTWRSDPVFDRKKVLSFLDAYIKEHIIGLPDDFSCTQASRYEGTGDVTTSIPASLRSHFSGSQAPFPWRDMDIHDHEVHYKRVGTKERPLGWVDLARMDPENKFTNLGIEKGLHHEKWPLLINASRPGVFILSFNQRAKSKVFKYELWVWFQDSFNGQFRFVRALFNWTHKDGYITYVRNNVFSEHTHTYLEAVQSETLQRFLLLLVGEPLDRIWREGQKGQANPDALLAARTFFIL